MILTQHYLGCLSHASYLVGDKTTGRAVVVDPRRDVDIYLEEASAEGLMVERVIETHIHADFVGGHLELAARYSQRLGTPPNRSAFLCTNIPTTKSPSAS
jgi:glyoxylase-like metal-dependent hydrolase (beta-lactamase superfamily II)